MKPSNPKISFDPGFFVAKKILTLVVLFCFLVFFSSAYANGSGNHNDPFPWEHPWDELESEPEHGPPEPPQISDVIIFPCGHFAKRIIIYFPQVKNQDNEKDQVQIHSSDKNRGRFFLFF